MTLWLAIVLIAAALIAGVCFGWIMCGRLIAASRAIYELDHTHLSRSAR